MGKKNQILVGVFLALPGHKQSGQNRPKPANTQAKIGRGEPGLELWES